jgi:polyhydroxyalkanoate synthesis regulator phasin
MNSEQQAKVEPAQHTAPANAEQAPEPVEKDRPLIVEGVGKLALAMIGAVGLAQDALEHLVNRMVERGEISHKEARRLIDELQHKHPDLTRHGMQRQIETVRYGKFALKTDIQALHDQIAALSAKVDQLSSDRDETKKPTLPKSSSK